MVAPERATVWADTCVVVDFDTMISLAKNARGGQASIDATRASMRAAAWMAMAFDERRVISVTFYHEMVRLLLEQAPPESPEGQWTAVAHRIVRPYVCPNWCVKVTGAGEMIADANGNVRPADNDERDAWMIDAAREYDLTIVTSDRRAAKRAREAGVVALAPDIYASSVISFDNARVRFMQRLDVGINAFLAARGVEELAHESMEVVRSAYASMWDCGPNPCG